MLNARSAIPFVDLGRHFARAHAVSEHLDFAAHVGGQSADAIQARRCRRSLRESSATSSPAGSRRLIDQLNLRADGRAFGVRIADEADHDRRPARPLRRRAERAGNSIASRDVEIEFVRLVCAERILRRAHDQPERVEQRMGHDDAMPARPECCRCGICPLRRPPPPASCRRSRRLALTSGTLCTLSIT